jgi:hypothetical protein
MTVRLAPPGPDTSQRLARRRHWTRIDGVIELPAPAIRVLAD